MTRACANVSLDPVSPSAANVTPSEGARYWRSRRAVPPIEMRRSGPAVASVTSTVSRSLTRAGTLSSRIVTACAPSRTMETAGAGVQARKVTIDSLASSTAVPRAMTS